MNDEAPAQSTADRLFYMANQIARNLAVQGDEAATAATADHLCSFWTRDMRDRLILLAAERPGALTPIAAAAVRRLSA